MAKIAPYTFWQSFDDDGDPLAGGKLYTYSAGTTTPKDTFTTSGGGVANANPVILDANGRANIWLETGSYDFVLHDSSDVLVTTADYITGDTVNVFGSSVVSLSTNTNITVSHENNILDCTGTITLSLLDVATALEGFIFSVKNSGSGVITLDPDGLELIDRASTIDIEAGQSVMIACNGSAWISLYGFDFASQAEAEAGTATDVVMNPLRTKQAIDALAIMPVGSVYMNYSDSTNPATLLGYGTWVALQDNMLIGAGGTYTAGATGGSATTTQTTSTMAAHTHVQNSNSAGAATYRNAGGSASTIPETMGVSTDSAGGGSAMTTISPYVGVYMWYRSV